MQLIRRTSKTAESRIDGFVSLCLGYSAFSLLLQTANFYSCMAITQY